MITEKIKAQKISNPMQLSAVWLRALLLIDTTFLVAAVKLSNPYWVRPALVIAAICFVPVFLIVIFLLQTVFRKELQEDRYYSKLSP